MAVDSTTVLKNANVRSSFTVERLHVPSKLC